MSLNAGTGPVLNGNINFNARNEKVNFFFSYGARHYQGYRNSYSYWDTDLGDTLLELNQLREGTDLNQNQNKYELIPLDLVESEILAEISVKLNEAIRQRERLLQTVTKYYPGVQELEAQIENYRLSIQRNIKKIQKEVQCEKLLYLQFLYQLC